MDEIHQVKHLWLYWEFVHGHLWWKYVTWICIAKRSLVELQWYIIDVCWISFHVRSVLFFNTSIWLDFFDVLQSTYFPDSQWLFFWQDKKNKNSRESLITHRSVWWFLLRFLFFEPKESQNHSPKVVGRKSSPKNHPQINYHRKIIHKIFGFPLLLFFLLQAQTSHGVLVRVFTPPGIAVVTGDLWKHTTIGCFFVINSTPIWTDQDPYEPIRIQSTECH